MAIYWRISKHADLSGAGGKIVDGRWHTKGSPVVYMAESHAGALLESLVHLDFLQRRLPETYTLLKIDVPEGLSVQAIEPPDLSWRERVDLTRSIGNAWLSESKSLLLRVPSAIVSETWNALLNPSHAEISGARIVSSTLERFDRRLFRSGKS